MMDKHDKHTMMRDLGHQASTASAKTAGEGDVSLSQLIRIEAAIWLAGANVISALQDSSCDYAPPSFEAIDRSLWEPMYQPPTETGWYLVWWKPLADPVPYPMEISARFFDAGVAAAQRVDPGLASKDPSRFGWAIDEPATHWRRLPEGPEE